MNELTTFERAIKGIYAILIDYFLAAGIFFYVRFTLGSFNNANNVLGIFWSLFVLYIMDRFLKNNQIEKKCFGRHSKKISTAIKILTVTFYALTVGV